MVRAFLSTLFVGAMLFFCVPAVVGAASVQDDLKAACAAANTNGGSTPSYCDSVNTTTNPVSGPAGIINRVADFIAYITGAVAVIMVIYGGFKYIRSNGDAQKTVSGRQTIVYALVGLVIIIVAKQLVTLIVNKLL